MSLTPGACCEPQGFARSPVSAGVTREGLSPLHLEQGGGWSYFCLPTGRDHSTWSQPDPARRAPPMGRLKDAF